MIRIAITGPESTGKSVLAKQLAKHYGACFVPEYARLYLEDINRPYTYEDILCIAERQFDLETIANHKNDLLFCDTDFCVTNIWCEVKYGKCHEWIVEKLKEDHYSLYLLCDIDLPWQYDPLREHPEMRQELFAMYHELLSGYDFNFKIVRGTGEQRLMNAIGFVDEFIESNNPMSN